MTISGGRSGLSEHAFVWLPPQYYQPAWAHRAFPAAEVLTGYPGNDLSLVNRMNYPQVVQQQVAAGHARPMVLVMLRPTVVPPRDTECTDVPAGPQVRDVPRPGRAGGDPGRAAGAGRSAGGPSVTPPAATARPRSR